MKSFFLCLIILITFSADSKAQKQRHHISLGYVKTFESPSLNLFYIGDVGLESIDLETDNSFRASYGYKIFKWLIPEIGIETLEYKAGEAAAAYEAPVNIQNRSFYLGIRTEFRIVGLGLDVLIGRSWSTVSFNYTIFDQIQDYEVNADGLFLGIAPHYNLTKNIRLKSEARITGFVAGTRKFSTGASDIDQFVTISPNLSLSIVFTL